MDYRDLERLYDKHGGKFAFATLLQRRVAQLVSGEKRLVKCMTNNPVEVALEEIKQGKIWYEDEEIKMAADDGSRSAARS